MSTEARPARRPLRADAERNRRLILDAAKELFAAKGLHVGLDEIARHAGVGVGTVYRRFPDKDVLIEELFDDRIAALVGALDEAAAIEDPWTSFAEFLRTFAGMHAEDRGLKEVIFRSGEHTGRLDEVRAQIKPRVIAMVQRAHEAGVLRPDLAALDIALMNIMLGALADATRDQRPDAWERALTVILDGLRADGTARTPLPGEPLTDDEVQCAMRASAGVR